MDRQLTDEQAELLLAALDRIIEGDRYPLSARPSELDFGYSRRQLFTSEQREARRRRAANETPPLTTIVLEHDNG